MLFEFGFSMLVMAMNQPYYALTELSNSVDQKEKILKTSSGKSAEYVQFGNLSNFIKPFYPLRIRPIANRRFGEAFLCFVLD